MPDFEDKYQVPFLKQKRASRGVRTKYEKNAKTSKQRREAIAKGFEFPENDSDQVSWYRKPKTE
jgi:hypothetical protein